MSLCSASIVQPVGIADQAGQAIEVNIHEGGDSDGGPVCQLPAPPGHGQPRRNALVRPDRRFRRCGFHRDRRHGGQRAALHRPRHGACRIHLSTTPGGRPVLHLDAKMSGLGGATPTANPQQSEHRGHLRMAISRVIRTESVHGQWFPAHPLLSILTVRLRIHSVRVAQEEGPPARRLGESS